MTLSLLIRRLLLMVPMVYGIVKQADGWIEAHVARHLLVAVGYLPAQAEV